MWRSGLDALVREERARALGELAFVALSTGQGVSCALIGHAHER